MLRCCILADVVVALIVIHFSRSCSSLNSKKGFYKTPETGTIVIYGSSRNVEQQFAHRRMLFYLTNLLTECFI